MRLLDSQGRACAELATGDTLLVEVTFEARQPIESPIMGVAIFRDDGVYCYGPNTRHDGVPTGTLRGRHVLKAEFMELPLLPGGYEVSVAFYDREHVYAYAWDHRLYPFRVGAGAVEPGLVRLRHRFTLAPAD